MRVKKRTTRGSSPNYTQTTVRRTHVRAKSSGPLYERKQKGYNKTRRATPTVEYNAKTGRRDARVLSSTTVNRNTYHNVNVKKAGLGIAAGAAAYQGYKNRHKIASVAKAAGKSDVMSSANHRLKTAKTKTMGRVGRKR